MYEDKVNRNFQSKELAKGNALDDCLSLIILDSVIRVSKKYYPETLLEECKYKIKKNEKYNFMNDDLELDAESVSDESVSESEK